MRRRQRPPAPAPRCRHDRRTEHVMRNRHGWGTRAGAWPADAGGAGCCDDDNPAAEHRSSRRCSPAAGRRKSAGRQATLAKMGPDEQAFLVSSATLRHAHVPGSRLTTDHKMMYALEREVADQCIDQTQDNFKRESYYGLPGRRSSRTRSTASRCQGGGAMTLYHTRW